MCYWFTGWDVLRLTFLLLLLGAILGMHSCYSANSAERMKCMEVCKGSAIIRSSEGCSGVAECLCVRVPNEK